MDSSYLIDQRNICPKGVQRRSGGLGEIGAVEWIGIIQELDPTHKRGHGASLQGEFGSGKRRMRRRRTLEAGRQAGRQPPWAENRSSAVAKILLVLDRLHSFHAAAKGVRTVNAPPQKIRGTSSQCGVGISRAATSEDIAGV